MGAAGLSLKYVSCDTQAAGVSIKRKQYKDTTAKYAVIYNIFKL
jgi:hypothetical protein